MAPHHVSRRMVVRAGAMGLVATGLTRWSLPAMAQDATPAPLEVSTETREASAESQAEAVGGESAPSAMPSAGVGGGFAAGGTGPLSLGALVGAGVAAIFALRERLKNR